MQRFPSARPSSRIPPVLVLFIVLLSLAALLLTRPSKSGDFQEYALMTIGLAEHGTPDIRLSDLEISIRLSPEPGFAVVHDKLRTGIQGNIAHPFPGFIRGSDDRYYAIHFFAYPALAALPFKLIDSVGGHPFKAFQLVNLSAVAILTIALYRFTGSPWRAMFGTVFFLLSGGLLYSNWSSPEFFSACALLSGLLLGLQSGQPARSRPRPYLAALFVGVAAMQNPPLVFFAAFAPVVRLCYIHAHDGLTLGAALRQVVTRHTIFASILVAALAAVPVLFNLAMFGVPSVIAQYSTNPGLITGQRLLSFFFDLNQGAIVGMPVAMLLVLAQLAAPGRLRWLPHTGVVLLFSVVMAIPSLSTVNWNSGASGMMRYALWGGMPLLYLALVYLQRLPRWPLALAAAMLLAQVGMVKFARSYTHVEFSPAARLMLASFPAWYEPEPEIFIERTLEEDGAVHGDVVAAYPTPANPVKILFSAESRAAHAALCGAGGQVDLSGASGAYPGGWKYLDGPPRCVVGSPAIGPRP